MDSNLTSKEQMHTYVNEIIIKDIIPKIPELVEKKKVYEKRSNDYDIQNGKYINCIYQIRNLNSQENKRYELDNNHHIASYNTQLSYNYRRMLLESIKIRLKKKRLYDEMCNAKKEYEDAFNLIVSHFNKYKEVELRYIIDYLDIETNSSEIDNKGGTLILESIIRDFEILDLYQLQLPQDKPYRGTISLMETLVNQIKECEIKIEKYNVFEEKLEFLNEEYKTAKKTIEEKENIKNKIESVFINKLLRRDELEDLKFELKSLYMVVQNILTEFDLYRNAVKMLLNEKNEMCLKCIKDKLCIDLIINRLGEKSLRELINKLNIVIPKSDDNYFNEKEEMKKLIKKYFEEFQEKINNEINKEKELEENNHWSKIDVMNIISYMQKDEKHLIKK